MSKKKAFNYGVIVLFLIILSVVLYLLNISNVITFKKLSLIIIVLLIGLICLVFYNNKNESLKSFSDWGSFLAIVVGVFLIIINYFIFSSQVSGMSMNPTLKDGKRVFVYVFNYEPKVDDIAVYRSNNEYIVKKIVAVKGDLIKIQKETNNQYILLVNGSIYRNTYGEVYYLDSFDKLYQELKDQEYMLKEDEIVLLGDNERFSSDSRQLGILKTNELIGRVLGDFYGKE